MTRILAIRPEPGLTATLESGRKLGLEVTGVPLFEIRPVAWTCPDPDSIDALLIGSANAILHGGKQLDALVGKPVHAVGEATATAAREAGFQVAAVGVGGLQKVLDAIPAPTRLLRIAGADHVALVPPEAVTIYMEIAYESVPLALPETAIEAFQGPAVILLHSGSAAAHFAKECQRLDLDRTHLTLAALGPRILEGVGEGWQAIHIAPRPRDSDLLEMVRDLCLY